MLNLSIIAVGKLKEKYLRDACDEYSKRLGAFCKLNIIEINETRLPDNPTQSQILAAIDSEGKRIIAKIPTKSAVCVMCIEGKQLDSMELSQYITEQPLNGRSSICFIIGGSYGLSDSVKTLANLRLSISKMTFPHQLFRVILLEQIYRGFMIADGSKYHK